MIEKLDLNKRVLRIYKEAVIVDMCESFTRVTEENVAYFKTLADAGVTAVQATVPKIEADLKTAISNIAKFYKIVERSEYATIVYNATELESAKSKGKVAIVMGMQNSVPFERDLDLIRIFAMLGIKVMQIAYSEQNYLGAGCVEQVDHGLTDLGKKAVKEMNRLGILIDASHCGDITTKDIIKTSIDPIVFTHTTPAALVDIPRAKDDETIKILAKNGGIIGQAIYTSFCEKKNKLGIKPTIADFVDIVDYLVKLVGIDHVGLGSDVSLFNTKQTFDAFWAKYPDLIYPHKPPLFGEEYVKGFNDVKDIKKIIKELLTRGYSDNEAKKILGGNWLKLMKKVWK